MFRGHFEHSIDAKGRTAVPARIREALRIGSDGPESSEAQDPDTLIVTPGMERCLVAYPAWEWSAFEARLAALPQFDPAVVRLKRIYVAGAMECGLDKHGRLLLPGVLRDYAEIGREVVWAGMVNTVEIWAKERWVQQVAASRADPGAVARALGDLGL